MKLPGPEHPISIEPQKGRVKVTRNGAVIADTTKAMRLAEATYPAVLYVPREDADMEKLVRTSRTSHCPYKGDASYFSIGSGEGAAENAVWSYETPYPAMARIAGHLAFYADKVSIVTE